MPIDKWLARAKANKQLCHCESCLLVVAGEYAAIEAETLERTAGIIDRHRGFYLNKGDARGQAICHSLREDIMAGGAA